MFLRGHPLICAGSWLGGYVSLTKSIVCNHIQMAERVLALKKTSVACPSQWEGVLKDGRIVYARYRWGELTVGVGDGVDEAVRNGVSDQAVYAGPVGHELDGYMDFEELKAHLHGLLEFPATLIVENERPSNLDPEGLAELLVPPRGN